MGLDKLRCITPRRPGLSWFEMMNTELNQPENNRRVVFNFTFHDRKEVGFLGPTAQVRIHTKPGVLPAYFLELNFLAPGGKLPPLTVVGSQSKQVRQRVEWRRALVPRSLYR